MLKVNSLDHDFGDTPLLAACSLHLKKGENMTILGSNGAGKSTLAKILCGIIPSRYKVLLQGSYIEELDTLKRAEMINYVPAHFSLYDDFMTVQEYLQLSRYKHTPKEQQMLTVLNQLGLQRYQHTYARQLSSGEKQLLQLASALLQSAQITILDEPTSNLDPQKTKTVFDLLNTDPAFKQTILITHDLQLAYRLGYPILYLQAGRAHYFKEGFFEADNLQRYFQGTVMIDNDHIVEVL